MPKINQEEYEVLKDLDDEWKWVARDKVDDSSLYQSEIWLYENKPKRATKIWFGGEGSIKRLDSHTLFQFIQREDEEPYNIVELIEEYEIENGMRYDFGKIKVVDIDTSKLATKNGYIYVKESEETEVKDKKWLVDKWTKERNEADVHDPMYQFISEFIADANQLDEPEVTELDALNRLAQNMPFSADEIARHLEKLSAYHGHGIKLVPKQELPVIPKYIADWIEEYNWKLEKWKLPSTFRSDVKYKADQRHYEWANKKGNMDIFMKAILLGYEVEEEQKYYVLDTEDIPMLVRTYGDVNRANTHLGIHEKGRNTEHYQLTEQEIKDYDKRYMAFAVKVEELEE